MAYKEIVLNFSRLILFSPQILNGILNHLKVFAFANSLDIKKIEKRIWGFYHFKEKLVLIKTK